MKKVNRLSEFLVLIIVFFLLFITGCEKETPPPAETGTVTDKQGNVYKTVKIGTQTWMAENLRATKYWNAASIKQIETDTAAWSHDTTGAYCTGVNGLLYNWYAIHSTKHKIVPAGWHIPSDAEWKVLEEYLGMSAEDADKLSWRGTHEGEKLKITGVDNWLQHADVWATNESGFSALAGNCRLFNGKGGDPIGSGYMGFWWTNTEDTISNQAWYRYLDYKNANVFRFYGPKTYGFSVRCVKD